VLSGLIEAHLGLAWVQWAQGDTASAQTALEDAAASARQQNQPLLLDLVAANAARLLIAQGRSQEAAAWAADQQARFAAEGRPTHTSRLSYTTLVRWLLAQGHSAEAARLLDQLITLAEGAGLTGRLIELLVLQALAWQSQQAPQPAQGALERALTLAEPAGYIRIFVDEGEAMRFLIVDCRFSLAHQPPDAQQSRLLVYLEQILSAFDPTQSPLSIPAFQRPLVIQNPKLVVEPSKIKNLVEPLSRRELEVLRLLAAGRSTQAIGAELFITTGTVKNHLKSIFGKLDVHSRFQAVERARGLNLL
jgi:LuxR family maltose regulon positive regulatory protein